MNGIGLRKELHEREDATFDDTAKDNDVIYFLLFSTSSLTSWCKIELSASDVVIAEGVEVEPMSLCCVVADGMAAT